MLISYININPKNISAEEQTQMMDAFVKEHGFKIDMRYSARNIAELLLNIQSNSHTIIVANIVSLGESLAEIIENLQNLFKQQIDIISVTEDCQFTTDIISDDFMQGMKFALECRTNLLSVVSKKALSEKKIKSDWKAGRPSKMIKLEHRTNFIVQQIARGVPKAQIARQCNVPYHMMYRFLKTLNK